MTRSEGSADAGGNRAEVTQGKPRGVFRRVLSAGAMLAGALVIGLAALGLGIEDEEGIPLNRVGRYLEVRGERLRVHQVGQGQDVLFIHGCPGVVEDFKEVMDAGSSRYRLTAFDRPGHGYSARATEANTIAYNADVALALVEELKLREVIVVGHSYGGAVALALAGRNLPQFKAFVLLGSLAPLRNPPPPEVGIFDLLRLPGVGRGLAVVAGRTTGPVKARAGFQAVVSPNDHLLTEAFVAERLEAFMQPKVLLTLAAEVKTAGPDLELLKPSMESIQTPVLLLHGEQDKIVPVATAKDFQQDHPKAVLTVLTNTGHFVQGAHPEKVLAAIDAVAERR